MSLMAGQMLCMQLPKLLLLIYPKSCTVSRVCSTMLGEEARNTLAIMLSVYGGKFSASMTKRNTHLVLPSAQGEKFQAALKWGVKPVTMAWVVESALLGMPSELASECKLKVQALGRLLRWAYHAAMHTYLLCSVAQSLWPGQACLPS